MNYVSLIKTIFLVFYEWHTNALNIYFLSLAGPHLQRTTTGMREAISTAERSVLIMSFLDSGDSQQSLCFSFKTSRAEIYTILSKTCEKLWEVLSSSYVHFPNS